MTECPLILTALVDPHDLQLFDDLRQRHFPPERNYLRAHITLFHKLPGEEREAIAATLKQATKDTLPFAASVSGLRHLGAGVAYTIASPQLQEVRAELTRQFERWLGPQDKQGWRPHITVQNKVTKVRADDLLDELQADYKPREIRIQGLALWRYLGGPWEHEATYPFAPQH